MAVIQFYTRRGCHLCEIMLEELLPMIRGRVDIEMCDIDSRAEWRDKFDVRVPVIEFEGALISDYPLDYDAVQALLVRLADSDE